jgi:hypothetical protein
MTYNLPDGIFEEIYNEVPFLFPFSLTGAILEMKIYRPGSTVSMITYTDNLEIDPTESKRLKIKEHEMGIKPGYYFYKIRISIEGVRRTYIHGYWLINE